jgi:hypothetical protein
VNILRLHALVLDLSEYALCVAFLLDNLMSVKDTKDAAKESAKDGLSTIRNIMAITGNISL